MKIYHNPRCSKSRETLQLIRDAGVEPEIVEYLKNPPTADELRDLLKKLGAGASTIVRTGEDAYNQLFAGKQPTDDQLIAAIVKHPVLLERPIVIQDKRAIIGRPPTNVNALL